MPDKNDESPDLSMQVIQEIKGHMTPPPMKLDLMLELRAAKIITSAWGHKPDDPLGEYSDTKRKIIKGDDAKALAETVRRDLMHAADDKSYHEMLQAKGEPIKAYPPTLTELPVGRDGKRSYEILVNRSVLVDASSNAHSLLYKAKKDGVELPQQGSQRG